jgi:hypothetical protein
MQINGVLDGMANLRLYCKLHALMVCKCGTVDKGNWSVCECICVLYLSYLSVVLGRSLTLHSATLHSYSTEQIS